jgi:HEAT repeat protein
MGPDALGAESALIAGLEDADPHVRAVCAAALPQAGIPAERGVPALMKQLQTEPAVVAVETLGAYRGGASRSIPQLLELIETPATNADMRRSAVLALGRIGPDALPALPALLRALGDDRVTVREAAATTIGLLGQEAAAEGVPALITALNDAEPRVRRNALESLSDFGEASRAAAPEARRLLDDPDERVREAARRMLAAVAPKEQPPADEPTPVEETASVINPR